MLCLDVYVLDLDLLSPPMVRGNVSGNHAKHKLLLRKKKTSKSKNYVLVVAGVTNRIVQLCIYLYYACSKVQKCKDFHSSPVKCSHES